jgi:hypothetical protein
MLENFLFSFPTGKKFFFVREEHPKAKGERGALSLFLSRAPISPREILRYALKRRAFFFSSRRGAANVNAARRCLFPPRLSRREGKKEREREREHFGNEGAGGERKGKIRKFYFLFFFWLWSVF